MILIMRIMFLLLIVQSTCEAGQITLPKDANGWTIFTPSPDTRIVYVSASGNDSTGGVYSSASPEVGSDPFNPSGAVQPFATYGAAFAQVRFGYPDWILMKRGDTFYEAIGGNVNGGRSETEPALIGAYGTTGASPTFKIGNQTGLQRVLYNSNTWTFNFTAVSGLRFYAHTRDPGNTGEYIGNAGGNGLLFQAGLNGNRVTGILIEGCSFSFAQNNVISGDDGGVVDYITIRRTKFVDNYNSSYHSQGLGGSNVDNFILEENIFDHNGWYSVSGSEDEGQGTIYNHNTYFAGAKNTTFRNNIFMRGSNMNNKFTSPSGVLENVTITNNLYIDGHIGIGIETNYMDDPTRVQNAIIIDNVMTEIGRTNITGQGIAWYIQASGWDNGEITNNVMIHSPTEATGGVHIFELWNDMLNVPVSGNVVYGIQGGGSVFNLRGYGSTISISNNKVQSNGGALLITDADLGFGSNTFSNNQYYSSSSNVFNNGGSDIPFASWVIATGDTSTFSQITFPNSTRSIPAYMGYLGQTATIDAFIAAARAQDRYNWNTAYTAPVVNQWIKAGFGMGGTKYKNVKSITQDQQ